VLREEQDKLEREKREKIRFLEKPPLKLVHCYVTMGHGEKTNDFPTRTNRRSDSAVSQSPKYYIVEADALPEVVRKVARAKQLMEMGQAATVNAAVQAVGISRSAFYKYKDAVHPFQDMLHGRIVTIQVVLRDEPGVLSGVLNVFAGTGVNILTINQNIPNGGRALVTITAETSGLHRPLEELLSQGTQTPGVLKCELVAG
jgi:chorismate mutase